MRDVKADFPILRQTVHGKPLVYLDNGATTQKPTVVLDRMRLYYENENANIHRGVHTLSQRATEVYEAARRTVHDFVNAGTGDMVIFTRGTTEALNLLASSLSSRLKPGDAILLTELEHHSNIVPWQMACARTGAKLLVAPIRENGEVDLDAFQKLLGQNVKIVAFSHISNALGTLLPAEHLVALARQAGAVTIIDGAQGIGHTRVDFHKIDCDAYVFSGHKIYAPTGIGALVAKQALLESLPPYQGGGDMILSVSFEKTTYNELPFRFEAGTPPIAEAVGLAAALEYLKGIGFAEHLTAEEKLRSHLAAELLSIEGIRLIGNAPERRALQSFTLGTIHAHDLGTFLDNEGVAVRTGHHCAEPVHKKFGIPASVRASLGIYNNAEDVARLKDALLKAKRFFA